MTEITFRFVIELSEDTMQFLWELADEIRGHIDDEESDATADADASDSDSRGQ